MNIHSGRPLVIALAVAALVAAGSVVVDTAPAAAAGVENEGAGCAVPALPDAGSLPTNARLPDPFRRLDNTRITTTGDWRCRREEIERLAEKFVYGEKPAKPQTVTGTVSSSSRRAGSSTSSNSPAAPCCGATRPG